MIRPRIVRTLLYKEFLRYRYNWGLLIVVAALLALSALVSVGSRTKLAGFGDEQIRTCHILYRTRPAGARADRLVHSLARQPRPEGCVIGFWDLSHLARPTLAPDEMAIEIITPTYQPSRDGGTDVETWTVRYLYPGEPSAGSFVVRDWFVRAFNDYVQTRPRLYEETGQADAAPGSSALERVPLIVTALAIFALYLLSFNLYITSTGEEREKRVLLGLLLTPATPLEIIVAKTLFYGTASVAVAVAVVGMYQPRLLANPFLVGAAVVGSVAYVAIGTVVISIVRRQTTINTISMLYLIATSIIMILAQILPLFKVLQLLLVENYLHGLMKLVVAGDPPNRVMLGYLVMLAGLTFLWSVAAVCVFGRQGMAISRGR